MTSCHQHWLSKTVIVAAVMLALCPAVMAVESLFEDRVVAKGKGIKVNYSEVEEAVIAFKANRIAAGEKVSPDLEKQAERTILDRLVASQLLLQRVTDADKKEAQAIATQLVNDAKSKAVSEASFRYQLIAMGMTVAKFEAQMHEQSLVKAVIERELKPLNTISDEQVQVFYKDNPDAFQQPEHLRGSHILFSYKDPFTKAELPLETIEEKKRTADKVLSRAKNGDDFGKLAKEFSDDRSPEHETGEYTFARGQMPPEFDAAAFTLKTNQVSDLVSTRFGFHIIKMHEYFPAQKLELDAPMKEKVRTKLQQIAIQRNLPVYIEKLKKEAEVVLSLEAKP